MVYSSIAIHLLKTWTSSTNRLTGDLLRGLSYSAVSKVNQRFSEKLSTDRKLKRPVNKILTVCPMSRADPIFQFVLCQGLTPYFTSCSSVNEPSDLSHNLFVLTTPQNVCRNTVKPVVLFLLHHTAFEGPSCGRPPPF